MMPLGQNDSALVQTSLAIAGGAPPNMYFSWRWSWVVRSEAWFAQVWCSDVRRDCGLS